ncbi:MAG: thioredoxin [Planctomycetota bacterium]
MADGSLHKLNDETFASAIESQGVIAVAEFWASWCMPCRMVEPVVRQLAGEFEGRVIVAQIDTDQNRDLAHRFEISAVPTIVIFKDGEPVSRFVGLTGYDKLASALEDAIEGRAASEAATG